MAQRSQKKVPKGDPFSVRLSRATDQLVEAEARRTRRSKSAIVEALTEEAARTRRFPGIGFRGDDIRRRPWVIGSGLDVWEIVEIVESYNSPEEAGSELQLAPRQIALALAYRDAHPQEIGDAIAENRRPLDEFQTLYPFVSIVETPVS